MVEPVSGGDVDGERQVESAVDNNNKHRKLPDDDEHGRESKQTRTRDLWGCSHSSVQTAVRVRCSF